MFFRVPSTAEHHCNFYHNNVPVLIYFSLFTAASKQDAIADAMELCCIELLKNGEAYVGDPKIPDWLRGALPNRT